MTIVAAIDQGTTSTRCLLFDADRRPVAQAQREHRQIFPRPGWVEHDPLAIRDATFAVVRDALSEAGLTTADVAAIGITNQRETVVCWDRESGEPFGNAIVWQDTRTAALVAELGRKDPEQGVDRWRDLTGLPLATYFSGPKIRWALDHVAGLADAARAGRAICGTMDTWVLWWLTGGRHVTDVTNASRTQLFDLERLDWSAAILDELGIPRAMLPEVVPSSSRTAFGTTQADGPLGGAIAITGALGDQHAALLGQGCTRPGDAKNTYGTGCFVLQNTGAERLRSQHGLVTTVAWQLDGEPVQYALEGSIAVTGSLVQWLRDNLGLIEQSSDIESLAREVDDNGGVYIVPAFSGLFAPHWRPDARGVICGLTRYATKQHLARAALEATAYQTYDVLAAMRADTGLAPPVLKVDGGMTVNDLLMQFQADLLDLPVVRSAVLETTALGAATAAATAVGLWEALPRPADGAADAGASSAPSGLEGAPGSTRFEPAMAPECRAELLDGWNRALERSLGWTES